jgi:acetyl esterase/lipase
MPLDPRAQRLLDMLAVAAPSPQSRITADDRRRAFERLLMLGRLPEPIGHVTELLAPGPGGPVPLRQYIPVRALEDLAPALIYFHGGGLVAGSPDTHDALCRTLANAAHCQVVSIGYRLAPEHPFPAALDDGCAAALWVLAQARSLRIDPQRLGIAGDSAGANLAAVVCQWLTQTAVTRPVLQLLLCPMLDHYADTESRRSFGSGYLVNLRELALEAEEYLGTGADPADPRVSPLRTADLSALPETIIHTAEFDPMRDEGLAYAQRLTSAGVPVRYTCHPGMIHMFYALPAVIPYARAALAQIAVEAGSVLYSARLADAG